VSSEPPYGGLLWLQTSVESTQKSTRDGVQLGVSGCTCTTPETVLPSDGLARDNV